MGQVFLVCYEGFLETQGFGLCFFFFFQMPSRIRRNAPVGFPNVRSIISCGHGHGPQSSAGSLKGQRRPGRA